MLALTGVTVIARPMVEPQAAKSAQTNLQKLVSVKFDNAPVKDVLAWFRQQGVNFVAPIESATRLTISIDNEPLKDAVDAIAFAMGTSWAKKGDVYAFQPNSSTRFSTSVQGHPFQWKEDDQRAFEQHMKQFGDEMKAFKFDGEAFKEMKNFKWDEKDRKAFEMDMKKFGEEMKSFKFDGEALKELKSLKDLKIDLPDMKGFQLDMEKLHKELGESMKSFKMDDSQLKALKDFKMSGLKGLPMHFNGKSMGELMKSITDKQWELQKSQGFLKASDLTEEQRKMLGITADSKGFNIAISIDGKELKVKGE